jgi:hypothetical protein
MSFYGVTKKFRIMVFAELHRVHNKNIRVDIIYYFIVQVHA